MSRTDFQSDCEWNPIEGGIAEGKMRHYLNAAHQDKKVAAQMFHLDGAVAASFLEPIRLVELVLREAIHQNMTQVYGSRWMHQEELIDARSLEKVTHSANRLGKNPSGDKIVSDLSLGFWAGLFQKGGPASFDPSQRIRHSETLWTPVLSNLFKDERPERKYIAALTLKISYLRNRMAHHEPILFGISQPGSKKDDKQIKQEPINAYGDLIQLATMLDVTLGNFLLENFSVIDLLESELSQKALRHAKSRRDLYWI